MDPVTHSFLGMATAMAAVSFAGGSRRISPREAALAGLAAGLLPDVDVFLRNAADPLFFIEYHRHFTHSLLFSPVIALFAAGIAWALYRLLGRRSLPILPLLFPAWLAGLSHIFCDLWTSYGTRVWWPFSDARVSLDLVAVVDPLLTLPLIVGTIWALRRQRIQAALGGLAWVGFYLALAVVQHERALAVVKAEIAATAKANAPVTRITVKPSIANILVWRAMIQRGDRVEVLAVRSGLGWGRAQIISDLPPRQIPVFTTADEAIDSFHLDPASQQATDVRRFFHFSDGWVGAHPDDPLTLGDLRYATLPDEVRPLWGIRLQPDQRDGMVEWKQFTEIRRDALDELWAMVVGKR